MGSERLEVVHNVLKAHLVLLADISVPIEERRYSTQPEIFLCVFETDHPSAKARRPTLVIASWPAATVLSKSHGRSL